jgi:hypothetical protein
MKAVRFSKMPVNFHRTIYISQNTELFIVIALRTSNPIIIMIENRGLEIWDGVVWTGLIWLRIGTSGGPL